MKKNYKEIKQELGIKNTVKGAAKNKDKAYTTWMSMIYRCYNPAYQRNHPTYVGCEVCKEWLNFANYKKWYDKHIYYISDDVNDRIDLEKDLLVQDNRLYSPDTCCLIPHCINLLFRKNTGKSLYHRLDDNIWVATYAGKRLGEFETYDEAFDVYSDAKEERIKELAEKYVDYLDDEVYQTLINYRVISF